MSEELKPQEEQQEQEVKEEKKKKIVSRLIRYGGIIGLVVVIFLLFAAAYFFTDYWLESKIERTGTEINGALVEVDGLHFSIFSLNLKWDRLQITDPDSTMKNMIETGRTEFNLEFIPLLYGNVIIENIELSDFRTNTDRETDGAAPWVQKKKENEEPSFIDNYVAGLEERVAATPELTTDFYTRKVNVDSIINILDLQAPGKIDSFQNVVMNNYDSVSALLNIADIEQEVKEIETKIKSINVNELKTPDKIAPAVVTVNEISESLDKLKKRAESTKDNVLSGVNSAADGIEQVDDWVKADYNSALSKAKLPDIDLENIGMILFGDKVVNQVKKYLGYVDEAREYAEYFDSGEEEKEPEPPRFQGQDIYFPGKKVYPDFWIKQIKLSGQTEDSLKLAGLINDIVSNQKIVDKVTKLDIKGSNAAGVSLALLGTLDYLKEDKKELFTLDYKGIPLRKITLSNSNLIPNEIDRGLGNIDAKLGLTGKTFTSEIKFNGSELQFASTEAPPQNKLEEITNDIISGLNNINVNAKIKGIEGDLDFTISSNIGKLFVDSFNNILSREVENAKQQLREEVNKQVEKYRQELNIIIEEQKQKLTAQVESYISEVDQVQKLLDEKKQDIEKKKKELEGDAKNKIIDLFK